MLTADKSSLQTGKNDHINGKGKCKRCNIEVIIYECFLISYKSCGMSFYILNIYFLILYHQIYCACGPVSNLSHPCYGCEA